MIKIYGDLFLPGTKTGPKESRRGGPGVATPLGRAWRHLVALDNASRCLFAYKLPKTLKTTGMEKFSTKQIRRHRHLESPI